MRPRSRTKRSGFSLQAVLFGVAAITIILTSQGGFTLIELMLSLVTLLVISGSAFQLMNLATQRSATEQTKLDLLQEGREFMDQMSRDLRQAGYPNPRNCACTSRTAQDFLCKARTVRDKTHKDLCRQS